MQLEEPILITGCARSGTSLTAGVINYCGAFGGDMSGATRNNKKGMFENSMIRETIIKPILRGVGADPMGQNPLPDIKDFENKPELVERTRGKVIATMRAQGLRKQKWFYKGAKMCLMWNLWHKIFPKAKWVVVRRDDDGIIDSCLKTGFMQRHKDREGWQQWIDIHKERFREMERGGLDMRYIYPREMVESDFTNAKRIINWTGLEWNEEAILHFITPALWSNIKRKYEGGK